MRREEQEHDDEREREDHARLVAGLALLIGGAGPFERHRIGQHVARDFLHLVERLAGAVAGRGLALDLRGAVDVVMRDVARPGDPRQREQRRERHHLAALGPHIQPLHVLGIRAQVALGLRVHAEQAPEAVEVIDVGTAHERLEGLEDGIDAHAERLRLDPVEIDADLRRVRAERREQVAQLLGLARLVDDPLRDPGELLDGSSTAVLQLELEAADARESAHRRRVQREHARTGDRTE